jgi:nucleotide-binding universal stress UspA family protein
MTGKEMFMRERILLPVDNSATTELAVSRFLADRENFSDRITLLHVLEDQLDYHAIPELQLKFIREQAHEAGWKLLERFGQRFEEAGFNPELRLEKGDAVAVIQRLDGEGVIFLLVMARHDASEISDVLFGSVTSALMHKVKCPMLLY